MKNLLNRFFTAVLRMLVYHLQDALTPILDELIDDARPQVKEDIRDTIERVIDNYNFEGCIEDAMRNYNLERSIEEAITEADIERQVERAVDEKMEAIDLEVEVKRLVRKEIARILVEGLEDKKEIEV